MPFATVKGASPVVTVCLCRKKEKNELPVPVRRSRWSGALEVCGGRDCFVVADFLGSFFRRCDLMRCAAIRCAALCPVRALLPSLGVRFVVEESSRVPGRLYGRDRAGVASPRRGGEIDGSRRSVVTTFGLGSRCTTTRLLPEEDVGEASVELGPPTSRVGWGAPFFFSILVRTGRPSGRAVPYHRGRVVDRKAVPILSRCDRSRHRSLGVSTIPFQLNPRGNSATIAGFSGFSGSTLFHSFIHGHSLDCALFRPTSTHIHLG